MEKQTRLRAGIVGCGYQGGILAQTIARSNVWQVTACADPDLAAAGRVAAIVGSVPVYASVEDLLQRAEVDAVIVATAHAALYESALVAIHAGKHLLVEKPIGMDETEATQLEEAVAQANLCFMSGYSFRYLAAWQKVRELLQAGAVGEIENMMGSICIGPMSSGWKAAPESGGGPMLFVGCHLVDQMLWYMGDEPAEVYANIRYRADTHAEETTTFQIRFARGALAQGMVTQANVGFTHHLDIFGRQGRISLRTLGGFNYRVEVTSNALPAYTLQTSLHFPQMDDLRLLKHHAQLTEFAQSIGERRQPACTVSDGRRVLKLLDGFVKSQRTGQAVRLG